MRRSSFGALGLVIQHRGFLNLRDAFKSRAAKRNMDLPRCDAQFPSFSSIMFRGGFCLIATDTLTLG
eukprot:2841335-Amphidinium_carterae.1